MSPLLLLSFVLAYFLLLLVVAWRTSRGADNESFFIGNRNSNWMLVAFGMIGTSLSGVTFVSVPGAVARDSFSYFQITLGYFLGYLLIAYVLLPLYYRIHLTSIYNYLNERLGFSSYKTGAAFFILSRVLGATARLYLVVNILQDAILSGFHVPFWLTTLIILLMILLYTYEGGVKTIVWTDTLQTSCMLGGMIICVIYILHHLNLNLPDALDAMKVKGYSKVFFTDPDSKLFFLKQIIAGMFITVTMTGMDQEMMQKGISVPSRSRRPWTWPVSLIPIRFALPITALHSRPVPPVAMLLALFPSSAICLRANRRIGPHIPASVAFRESLLSENAASLGSPGRFGG